MPVFSLYQNLAVYIVSICYVTSLFIDLMTNKLLLLYYYYWTPMFLLCRCKHETKTFRKSSQRYDVWEGLNL